MAREAQIRAEVCGSRGRAKQHEGAVSRSPRPVAHLLLNLQADVALSQGLH